MHACTHVYTRQDGGGGEEYVGTAGGFDLFLFGSFCRVSEEEEKKTTMFLAELGLRSVGCLSGAKSPYDRSTDNV